MGGQQQDVVEGNRFLNDAHGRDSIKSSAADDAGTY
jgi:hypothetical protein